MSRVLTNKRRPVPKKDEPFYGWRFIQRVGPSGAIELEQVLLTLEDVLHPREDDVIPEHPFHEIDKRYLCNICRSRESRLDRGLTFCDCLVNWGIPGLGNHSPDISVFARLKHRPERLKGTFDFRASGGKCLAAIEIVSPHTRTTDVVGKFAEYHRVKIPLFIIIDREKEDGPRAIRAYRYRAVGFEPISLDDRGCVAIRALGINLGLKDERVVCYDLDTGAELGDYGQVERAYLAAEQGRISAVQGRIAAEQALAVAEEQAKADKKRIQELEVELQRKKTEPKANGSNG